MCVILQRDPDYVIDKESWDNAIINNPDGWGISVPDGNGLLTTLRSPETADDTLYDMIHNEFGSDPVLIHLRYTTAGETTMRNAHPFPILEQATDGVDLRMAHNGTLTKYKPGVKADNDWESDTRVFVRTYVRPLFKRLIKGMDIENILTDPFIYNVLNDQLSAASVLAFIDGFGNTMQINPKGNGGDYTEGLWYSNTYSFDPTHRVAKTYSSNTYGPYYNDDSWWWDPKRDAPGNVTSTSTTTTKTGGSTDSDRGGADLADTKTELFTERHDIDNPEDLFDITDDTIEALLEDSLGDSALLIKELLYRWHDAERKLKLATLKKERAEKACEQLSKKLKEATDAAA